jgi:hypothetical protein
MYEITGVPVCAELNSMSSMPNLIKIRPSVLELKNAGKHDQLHMRVFSAQHAKNVYNLVQSSPLSDCAAPSEAVTACDPLFKGSAGESGFCTLHNFLSEM